jgi:tyrosyl-tRNA synthetase
MDGLPTNTLDRNDLPPTLTQLLAQVGVAGGKQIKDALAREAVLINGRPVTGGPTVTCEEVLSPERAIHGRFFLVRFGKKKYHLLIGGA